MCQFRLIVEQRQARTNGTRRSMSADGVFKVPTAAHRATLYRTGESLIKLSLCRLPKLCVAEYAGANPPSDGLCKSGIEIP